MSTTGKNIEGFQFGVSSPEYHARFTKSLYTELDQLKELGLIDPELTFWEIGDAVMDTIDKYSEGPVNAAGLVMLIGDTIERLRSKSP